VKLVLSKKESSQSKAALESEVKTIYLTPDQVDEVMADDYTLTLFNGTRVQPLSLLEIKRHFPEPSENKAQLVLNRLMKVDLIIQQEDGRYFSKYPKHFINFADYKYASEVEARKDQRIFQMLREYISQPDYWRIRTYFSIEAFFSPEQTQELREMFNAIKAKAKEFADENAKKGSLKGLVFRRMKFYDMIFSLLAVCLISLGATSKGWAGGTGIEPRSISYESFSSDDVRVLNANLQMFVEREGEPNLVDESPVEMARRAGVLLEFIRSCDQSSTQFCQDVRAQAARAWRRGREINM